MSQYSTDNDNIIIDFSRFPFCFRCVSIDKFTNKLKDSNEFFNYFKEIFEKVIPAITKYNYNNVTTMTNKHSHVIPNNSKEYSIIIKILKAIHKEYFPNIDFELFLVNNINDYSIWQLGITGGVRIIGIRKCNVFSVLFIDYHHLIYPDKNYNQKNYLSYNFSPI